MANSKSQTDRVPPQNIDAEQSVLGALMLSKDTIVRVADLLRPGDFYRQIHNIIFEVMLELYEKSEPIDVLSLTGRLEDLGKLEEIGYLATFLASPASDFITGQIVFIDGGCLQFSPYKCK